MAIEGPCIKEGSRTAQVDLSAWQYKPVKIGTTGTVDKCDATNDVPFGILQNKPTAGQACEVVIFGVTKAYAGETLVIGELLSVQVTSGELITGASASHAVGTCMDIAGDGELATVLVNVSNTVAA